MAIADRLRSLIGRTVSASRVGVRRQMTGVRRQMTGERRGDAAHEDGLRAMLGDNPNNEQAFRALAEIVRRHANAPREGEDPLTAPLDPTARARQADLAVWALAEEFSGNPRAWYPLLELARLSIQHDHDGAIRRLATAAERDSTGEALAEGLAILRQANLNGEAIGLGIGQWRPLEHTPRAAKHLIGAMLDSGRPLDARRYLEAIRTHQDTKGAAAVAAEFTDKIAQAESDAMPDRH